jgi:hypothetical protein
MSGLAGHPLSNRTFWARRSRWTRSRMGANSFRGTGSERPRICSTDSVKAGSAAIADNQALPVI